MANQTEAYTLKNGVKLPLEHSLFDNDAVILENTSQCVAVKSDKESRYVTLRYEEYPFIGFWHACKKDAPYVCLEPWSALPGIEGQTVALETKPHMTRVPVNEKRSISFHLEIHE